MFKYGFKNLSGNADIDGLVREIKKASDNVTITETNNIDGTKNVDISVDGITASQFSTALTNYYTKAESDINYPTKNSFNNLSARVSNVEASKANVTDVYNKIEVDTVLSTKANSTDVYTKTQADANFTTKNTTNALTNRVSNLEVDKINEIIGTNITATKTVSGTGTNTNVKYELTAPKQRVISLADLGITDVDFQNLPNKPSTTDAWSRHYSLKDCLLKILTKNTTIFDKNTILIDSVKGDKGFPDLCKHFGQYLEHLSLKNSNTTFRTYSMQITTNRFFISNGDNENISGDIFGSWSNNVFTPTGITTNQIQEGIKEEDVLYNDNSSNDTTVINNFIVGVVHVTSEKKTSIKIGRDINTNLYKSLCRLFNLPLTYNLGFVFEIGNGRSLTEETNFTIYAKDNANKKLDFIYNQSAAEYKPINKSKTGFVKYTKTIQNITVSNNTNYLLSDNMSIANNIENYVLGGKVGGIWGFNYPINVDGLMFVNHNRYVNLDIQVRLNINVGSFQGLKIRIKRGDGTYVDNNIGNLNTSPDTPETTTLMTTYSVNANDLFVTQGFALELSNASGASITLPAQTVQVHVGLTYY